MLTSSPLYPDQSSLVPCAAILYRPSLPNRILCLTTKCPSRVQTLSSLFPLMKRISPATSADHLPKLPSQSKLTPRYHLGTRQAFLRTPRDHWRIPSDSAGEGARHFLDSPLPTEPHRRAKREAAAIPGKEPGLPACLPASPPPSSTSSLLLKSC